MNAKQRRREARMSDFHDWPRCNFCEARSPRRCFSFYDGAAVERGGDWLCARCVSMFDREAAARPAVRAVSGTDHG